jgi:predicted metalloprotease
MDASYAAGDRERTTHGTPEERRDWFLHGDETGQPSDCQPPR